MSNALSYNNHSFIKKPPRKYGDPIIMKKILSHYPFHVLPDKIRGTFQRWGRCGKFRLRYFNKELKYYPINCKHPYCPRCNEWMKVKEAKIVVEKLQKIAGPHLNPEHMSYITVDGDVLKLGSDFRPSLDFMKKKTTYRFKNVLDVIFLGEFEIAMQNNNNHPYNRDLDGMLHFHGWCYHPNTSRKKIAVELKKIFTRPNAVHFGKPDANKEMYDNIKDSTVYTNDNDLNKFKKKKDDRNSVDINELDPETLLNLLVSMESIRPRGRMGLRYEVGVRAALKKYDELIVPVCDNNSLPTLLENECIHPQLEQQISNEETYDDQEVDIDNYPVHQLNSMTSHNVFI